MCFHGHGLYYSNNKAWIACSTICRWRENSWPLRERNSLHFGLWDGDKISRGEIFNHEINDNHHPVQTHNKKIHIFFFFFIPEAKIIKEKKILHTNPVIRNSDKPKSVNVLWIFIHTNICLLTGDFVITRLYSPSPKLFVITRFECTFVASDGDCYESRFLFLWCLLGASFSARGSI